MYIYTYSGYIYGRLYMNIFVIFVVVCEKESQRNFCKYYLLLFKSVL